MSTCTLDRDLIGRAKHLDHEHLYCVHPPARPARPVPSPRMHALQLGNVLHTCTMKFTRILCVLYIYTCVARGDQGVQDYCIMGRTK